MSIPSTLSVFSVTVLVLDFVQNNLSPSKRSDTSDLLESRKEKTRIRINVIFSNIKVLSVVKVSLRQMVFSTVFVFFNKKILLPWGSLKWFYRRSTP